MSKTLFGYFILEMNYAKTMQSSYAMNYAFFILVSNFLRAEFHEKPASNRQIRIFSALKTKYGLSADNI